MQLSETILLNLGHKSLKPISLGPARRLGATSYLKEREYVNVCVCVWFILCVVQIEISLCLTAGGVKEDGENGGEKGRRDGGGGGGGAWERGLTRNGRYACQSEGVQLPGTPMSCDT
jgi:hypothetical protein